MKNIKRIYGMIEIIHSRNLKGEFIIFIYLYSSFLTILFTVVMSLSFGFYLKDHKKNYLLISLYFLLLIFNNLLITLSEDFSNFANYYNNQFMVNPILQTLSYLGIMGIALILTHELSSEKIKNYQYVIYIFFALWLLLTPFLENSALKVWLYYLPSQLLTFYFGLYSLKNYKKEYLSERWQKYTKMISLLAISFACIILLEDSFVIFFKDIYKKNILWINHRNISEDIFHILLSLLAFKYFLTKYKVKTIEKEDSVPILVQFPKADKKIDEEDLGQKYFDKFINHYSLTSREAEILFLLLQKRHNKEIANKLYLSIGTVKTHTHNIYIKLSAEGRSEVIEIFKKFRNLEK
ncbi:MAG: LuxR C-terminal-related transcriptional regulator [Lactovum sp.]